MKDYQFEEITALLSIIITLIAYHLEINWLFYIFMIKSWIDVLTTIIFSIKYLKKNKNE